MQTLECEAEICRSILNDLKFQEKPCAIKELVDEIGLYVTAFTNSAFRNFYEASVRIYARSATGNEHPTFQELLVELESTGDPNILAWKKKYSDKSKERHNYSVAARLMMDAFLGKEAKSIVQEWLTALGRESIREEIASLVSLLMNLTTDGHSDARPGSILEKAWAAGVRDPEPTGFTALDREWGGGWRPKWLVTIGMPSGGGKTSSAVSFMCERARQGRYTLFNSFEQPSEELLFKGLCNLSGVLTLDQVEQPDKNIRTQQEWDALEWSKAQLDKYVRIYDTQCKVEEVAMRTRRHQAEFGPLMDFVVIDHIGIVEQQGGNSAAEWSRGLEKTAYYLKNNVSKAYNVCTAMYSQVPPEVTMQLRENNRTSSDQLRGSAGIKNAVDVLVMGCRHNGKVRGENGKMEYSPFMNNVAVFQTTKMRRDGNQSYIGIRYDPSHHRLKNEEVCLQ